jgi:glycosyltransferase involved in cell wall biosynthesis
LSDKLRREQFSILHCHEYKSNLLGAVAASKVAAPAPVLIATVRHTEPGFQMACFQGLDSLVLHRFDRLTIPSQGALEELRRWPALQRRAHVIHHAVEEFSSPAAPPVEFPPADGPVISIVGRLQAVKGHRIYLEAARAVLAARPDAKFWIVGDGELRRELEAVVSKDGLRSAVSFLGYRSDALQLIAMSDVVVSASHYESFGRVVLEASALGRPVVATAVGGTPEIVIDGETGLLVPAADPAGLARAVLRLLNDPEFAQRLGAAGRAFVRQRYSLESQATALAALYQEAVACTSVICK